MDACIVGLERCHDQMPCPQHDLYKPIRQRLKAYMQTTTLADLAASLHAKLAWHARQGDIQSGAVPATDESR
jgi:Rrf2 family transcriptional regulator, iron-sulfur cluster assembly transcription factor